MKKKGIIIGIIIILAAIVGVASYKFYINKLEGIGTPLEPIYKLVKIQHFDKGTYADYKALFTNPKIALTKTQFDNYRNTHKSNDIFKYDSDSIDGVMKHMKAEKEKNDLYKVYYLKNVNDEKEKKSANYWLVTKKNGKWLVQNGI